MAKMELSCTSQSYCSYSGHTHCPYCRPFGKPSRAQIRAWRNPYREPTRIDRVLDFLHDRLIGAR